MATGGVGFLSVSLDLVKNVVGSKNQTFSFDESQLASGGRSQVDRCLDQDRLKIEVQKG